MKTLFKLFLLLLVLSSAYWFLIVKGGHPTNDKDWAIDQAVMPYAEINGNSITIHDIRNFFYRSATEYDPNYYDATFDLGKLETVDFIMVPFSSLPGAAHVFLSFGFSDGRYVAISPEARREKDQSYTALNGLFNKYELMYVIADERDVIGVRANYRLDDVYVYPAKVSKENAQKLFIGMLNKANDLYDKPEFYNTFFNSCSTNLADRINEVTPGKVRFDMRVLYPSKSDELAFELDLLNINGPISETRKNYKVNDRADMFRESLNFSQKIREGRDQQ